MSNLGPGENVRSSRRSLGSSRSFSCRADVRFRTIADISRGRQIGFVSDEQETASSDSQTGQRSRIFHLAVIGGVFLGYVLVRVAWSPTQGFARFHVTDILAGVAIPSLFALVFQGWGNWERWAISLQGKLALVGGATAVWEGLLPLVSKHATADPVDVVCYVLGTLAQHCASQMIPPHQIGSLLSD